MRVLLSYIKKYWYLLLGQLAFATLWVASQLIIPRYMVDIIDKGVTPGNMNAIIQNGLLMIGATVVNLISIFITLLFLTQLNGRVSRDLRGDLFNKIISWSKESRLKFTNSTLITRTVNDVKQISNLIDLSLRKIYSTSLAAIGALVMAFRLDAKLALIILVIIPIILVLAFALIRRAMPQYSKIRQTLDDINLKFRENLTGIRVVKAFNKSEYEERSFKESTDESYEANIKAESTMMLLSPLVLLAGNLLTLAILYSGGIRATQGSLSVGVLIAIIEYATIALTNLQQFAVILTIFPRSQASLNRVTEILNNEEVIQESQNPPSIANKAGAIEMDDVSFTYPEASLPAVEDISLDLNVGETKAIVGSTGAGKSTLLRLMSRDFDVSEGAVRLNGEDIRDLTAEQIRNSITLVPQTSFLFSGSVRDNMLTGRGDATDEEIWEALDIAQIGDYFRNLPEGLDSYISQNAVNLSGGQKQRLSIARGLLKQSDFYFFDDCFSALDYATEQKVRQGIQAYLKGKGLLIVAQRISTIKNAEEIYVMENGRIVDHGNHEELSETSDIYQEILVSQTKTEGVA